MVETSVSFPGFALRPARRRLPGGAAVFFCLAFAACGGARDRDRGTGPEGPPTCADVAAAIADRYAAAGLVNGNKAALLANLEVACPTWHPDDRWCVIVALREGAGVEILAHCNLGEVYLPPHDAHLPGK